MDQLSNEQIQTMANLDYIANRLKENDVEFIEALEFLYGDGEMVDIETFYNYLNIYINNTFNNIAQRDIISYYYLLEMLIDCEDPTINKPKDNINGKTILFLLGLIVTPTYTSGVAKETYIRVKNLFMKGVGSNPQQFYDEYCTIIEMVYRDIKDVVKESYSSYHEQLENDGIYIEEVLEQNEADIVPVSPLDMMNSLTNMFINRDKPQ